VVLAGFGVIAFEICMAVYAGDVDMRHVDLLAPFTTRPRGLDFVAFEAALVAGWLRFLGWHRGRRDYRKEDRQRQRQASPYDRPQH